MNPYKEFVTRWFAPELADKKYLAHFLDCDDCDSDREMGYVRQCDQWRLDNGLATAEQIATEHEVAEVRAAAAAAHYAAHPEQYLTTGSFGELPTDVFGGAS